MPLRRDRAAAPARDPRKKWRYQFVFLQLSRRFRDRRRADRKRYLSIVSPVASATSFAVVPVPHKAKRESTFLFSSAQRIISDFLLSWAINAIVFMIFHSRINSFSARRKFLSLQTAAYRSALQNRTFNLQEKLYHKPARNSKRFYS